VGGEFVSFSNGLLDRQTRHPLRLIDLHQRDVVTFQISYRQSKKLKNNPMQSRKQPMQSSKGRYDSSEMIFIFFDLRATN